MIPQSPQPNEFNPDEEAKERVTTGERLHEGDFLADELAFARELNELFNLEREELPPLFVQTLYNEQVDLLPPARLEQRLRFRVFRKLQLPQRALSDAGAPEPGRQPRRFRLRSSARAISLGSLLAALLVCLLLFSPSLLNTMRGLLSQAPSAQFAPNYSQQSVSNLVETQYLSAREAQEAVPFSAYWLGANPQNYSFQSLLLHMGQLWSDGPVVELQYGHSDPRLGYGRLILREFRPAAGDTNLLVVPADAYQLVQINGQQAIYINGHWTREDGDLFWASGDQAQLLYPANGLIFWITADLRDESSPQQMEQLAEKMEQLYLGPPRPRLPELPRPPRAESAPELAQPVIGESDGQVLVAAFPDSAAAVYITLGTPPNDIGYPK